VLAGVMRMVMEVETVRSFLERYRGLQTLVTTARSPEEFMTMFSQLRESYQVLIRETAGCELRKAPAFNIFNILQLSRSEVRTHSAFLSHLLSPNASHGQGTLFLKAFLEHGAGKYPDFPPLPSFEQSENWLVSTENRTKYGRLDIVIQNPREGFLCVVENKVDSEEGNQQLKRYGQWMNDHLDIYPFQALCFLTIHGGPSRTAESTPFFRLSYHQDIAAWLEDTLEHIQAPGVYAVVQQYQAVAGRL
jgi:hypothetical protein